ncbi:MAG: hypothetical protein HQ498_11770 [Pseudohongiella sp.]|nr:hypothetical protein [Pseudohongiella sp.]
MWLLPALEYPDIHIGFLGGYLDQETGVCCKFTESNKTPDEIKNHPLLAGVDVPNTGGVGWSNQMVMGDLLVQTRALSEGMVQFVPDAPLTLNARDKFSGEIVASVPLPAPGQYGMMTYLHQGKQYIVVQIGSSRTDFPAALVAYRLPQE